MVRKEQLAQPVTLTEQQLELVSGGAAHGDPNFVPGEGVLTAESNPGGDPMAIGVKGLPGSKLQGPNPPGNGRLTAASVPNN
jgi:hypothetical protein